jgi:hypothetical protein|tara:strand:- start:399 stop:899 length:501 start_codon:yes stop_codon:yes gene_type:complete
MVQVNSETGFYMGKVHQKNDNLAVSDCVPTATANLLFFHQKPSTTIDKVTDDILSHPSYNGTNHGFKTPVVPSALQQILRKYFGNQIKVRLYSILPEDSIPNGLKPYNKKVEIGYSAATPFIAISNVEGVQHAWLGVGDPVKRLDADGHVHSELYPIMGFLGIEGL